MPDPEPREQMTSRRAAPSAASASTPQGCDGHVPRVSGAGSAAAVPEEGADVDALLLDMMDRYCGGIAGC